MGIFVIFILYQKDSFVFRTELLFIYLFQSNGVVWFQLGSKYSIFVLKFHYGEEYQTLIGQNCEKRRETIEWFSSFIDLIGCKRDSLGSHLSSILQSIDINRRSDSNYFLWFQNIFIQINLFQITQSLIKILNWKIRSFEGEVFTVN